MYRKGAPLLIHVLAGLHRPVTLGGLSASSAVRGLQHLNGVSTAAEPPPAWLALAVSSRGWARGTV